MSPQATTIAIGDEELSRLLQAAMAETRWANSRVVTVARRPWDYYSSFAMESLQVSLEDGSRLALLVKNVGLSGRLDAATELKPSFLFDPMREIEAYRTFLSPALIDAPTYFGSASDTVTGDCLLFVENIPGYPLWQFGEPEVWRQAARWLAQFHMRFANDAAIKVASRLLNYDSDFYSIWPRRAVEFARMAMGVSANRIAAIHSIERDYHRVVKRLLAIQPTLIHGEFVASNIIIQSTASGFRVRPVDWEMAAVGPGLMDLADLTSGKWTHEEKRFIAEEYRQALPKEIRPPPTEFMASLQACRVHRAMQWLGWAPNWSPPKEHVHDWLDEITFPVK